MHIRKRFLIYPPGYTPKKGNFQVRYSRLQAWKLARRLGEGTEVNVSIYTYPGSHTYWDGFSTEPLWEIVHKSKLK